MLVSMCQLVTDAVLVSMMQWSWEASSEIKNEDTIYDVRTTVAYVLDVRK